MANATYVQATAAIRAHLGAWSALPLVYENEEPSATEGGFAMVEIESDGAEQRSIGSPGSNWVEDTGAVVATVFVPSGTGADLARTYAGEIGELFRNRELPITAGACVRFTTPAVGRGQRATSENPQGVWFAVPVTVPFEFLRAA